MMPPSEDHPAQAKSLAITHLPVLVGISFAVVYAIGFLVANSFYGSLWVVSPSLLQARYAAAGLLWALYLTSSLLPAYYLISIWNGLTTKDSEDSETSGDLRNLRSWAENRIPTRRWVGRWLLYYPTLVLLAAAVLVALAMFLSPFLPVAVLVALGSHLSDVLGIALTFHIAVIGVAIFIKFSIIEPRELLDYRSNPHKAVLTGCLLVMHAIAFGQYIYPLVPASGGGARPLPVRLTLSQGTDLPPWTSSRAVRSEIPNAFLVSSDGSDLLLLLPVPQADSASRLRPYCPVRLQNDHVLVIRVQTDFIILPSDSTRPKTWSLTSRQIGPCP